eukprot:scaffold172140_cov18-Tisochrysis_lutea.AAC.1
MGTYFHDAIGLSLKAFPKPELVTGKASYMSSHEASNAGNFMSTLDRKQPYSREGKKGVDRKGSRSAARVYRQLRRS